MIHYHGTPITPMSELSKMAGKHFCVSFEDHRDIDWCVKNGQSVMLDNGAFSAFTKGKTIDFKAYEEWIEPYLYPPNWAIIPDVIDGSVEEQRELMKMFSHLSNHLVSPVWHMSLPINWLLELADNFPRFCFGSSGKYWQVGSSVWCRRADEAWNELTKRGHKSWVHMMRGLALCGDVYPFASADSTNVARNFKNKGSQICPERMARRIDSVQSPLKWNVTATQGLLI
tara:strand:- start:1054 stop:1737 length:684 start_codon:yes stop_codon:yes gene_type:complete